MTRTEIIQMVRGAQEAITCAVKDKDIGPMIAAQLTLIGVAGLSAARYYEIGPPAIARIWHWMDAHTALLLVARLLVYGVVLAGWIPAWRWFSRRAGETGKELAESIAAARSTWAILVGLIVMFEILFFQGIAFWMARIAFAG